MRRASTPDPAGRKAPEHRFRRKRAVGENARGNRKAAARQAFLLVLRIIGASRRFSWRSTTQSGAPQAREPEETYPKPTQHNRERGIEAGRGRVPEQRRGAEHEIAGGAAEARRQRPLRRPRK